MLKTIATLTIVHMAMSSCFVSGHNRSNDVINTSITDSNIFLCWYWTVGFENSHAGFTYLMYGVCFPIYYMTIALAVASSSPTAEIAGLMFSLLFFHLPLHCECLCRSLSAVQLITMCAATVLCSLSGY